MRSNQTSAPSDSKSIRRRESIHASKKSVVRELSGLEKAVRRKITRSCSEHENSESRSSRHGVQGPTRTKSLHRNHTLLKKSTFSLEGPGSEKKRSENSRLPYRINADSKIERTDSFVSDGQTSSQEESADANQLQIGSQATYEEAYPFAQYDEVLTIKLRQMKMKEEDDDNLSTLKSMKQKFLRNSTIRNLRMSTNQNKRGFCCCLKPK